MPSYVRLRDLIRHIRAQKTMADERAVVQKELAIIRTCFKEEDTEFRLRNVSKVLYLHMLGYPTHFAQLECLKLIASPKFGDKRMGYLGAMMLLDERTDVQMLLTNSLKVDMNSSNQYICCLALTTLGNICSSEMATDLCSEVEKLLKSSNALIRKKAALCTCRIIRKVPELLDNYMSAARQLLNDRNHGVVLAGVTLYMEACRADPIALERARKHVPSLVSLLRTLLLSGSSPDYDVNGVPDPFLQVKILQLLGLLGHNDTAASEAMSDVLAQVATNTEASRTVGNAVLYETARTIMMTRADKGLRVLAINILGRFLLNSDKNIRYVALNSLVTAIHGDVQAVQRHRTTIVDCLKDPDISIRRRAMELVFALMNHGNVCELMREILEFLDVADTEFKASMCTAIAAAAAKYAPNRRWHLDTLLKMLTSAGHHVTEELTSQIIAMITQAPEHHGYTTQRLYVALQDDISQMATVQIGCWCIGEYGDLLVGSEGMQTTEEEVLDLLEGIMACPSTSQVSKEYVITVLMKLSTRFQSSGDRIHRAIAAYRTNVDVELQQRATEYTVLFGQDSLRCALFERMPIRDVDNDLDNFTEPNGTPPPSSSPPLPNRRSSAEDKAGHANANRDADTARSASSAGNAQMGASASPMNLLDLLGDGDGASAVTPNATVPLQPAATPSNALVDLLGDTIAPQPPHPPGGATAATAGVMAYDKNGVRVMLQTERSPTNAAMCHMTVTITNSSQFPISGVVFQAAVPRGIKMHLGPASRADLPPLNGTITQPMRLANPSNLQLKMRVRLTYTVRGQQVQDQAEIASLE